MRNRVTIVKREFKVNKEKNTVVCIMTCRINAPEDVNYAYMSGALDNKINKILKTKTVYSPFVVIGTSKCHNEDTFDEVTGKRIAESRAKKDAYEKATLVWREVAIHYHNLWGQCTTLLNRCAIAKKIEKEHINKLTQ